MTQHLDAIIFDLGGVILQIDYNATCIAFEKLGLDNFSDLYSQAAQSGLFDAFETGKISPQAFINQLLTYLPAGTTPNQVVHAWNAMILEFPKENLDLLLEMKQQKRTFLLSNTNEIHIQCFNRKLSKVTGHQSLHAFFDKVYFSNEVQLRKPHTEIFDFVCREQGLIPGHTLFIDDSLQHIEGAKEMGLQTHHLTPGQRITEIF